MSTGECIRTLGGHMGPVYTAVVSPDGEHVVSGSSDCTVVVWDMTTGTCLQKLDGHTGPVHSVAVVQNGKRVVSASMDCTVRVLDLPWKPEHALAFAMASHPRLGTWGCAHALPADIEKLIAQQALLVDWGQA